MARSTKRLTARSVDTITKPGYHADGDGLYLVVDRSGARRWAFIYHTQGRRREMGLGRMPLKEAREAVDEARRQLRIGKTRLWLGATLATPCTPFPRSRRWPKR